MKSVEREREYKMKIHTNIYASSFFVFDVHLRDDAS
jgi:hypothetical protein